MQKLQRLGVAKRIQNSQHAQPTFAKVDNSHEHQKMMETLNEKHNRCS